MTLPALKLRALARFPVSVQGDGGIAVSKANGVWTVEPDFSQLAEIPGSSIGGSGKSSFRGSPGNPP